MSEVRAVETGPKARRGKLALGVAFVSSLLALTPAKAEGQFRSETNAERLCNEYESAPRRAQLDHVLDGGEAFVTQNEYPENIGSFDHGFLREVRDRLSACLQTGSASQRANYSRRLGAVETEIRARDAYAAAAYADPNRSTFDARAGDIAYQNTYLQANLTPPGGSQ